LLGERQNWVLSNHKSAPNSPMQGGQLSYANYFTDPENETVCERGSKLSTGLITRRERRAYYRSAESPVERGSKTSPRNSLHRLVKDNSHSARFD
jgi:hypothetical protein